MARSWPEPVERSLGTRASGDGDGAAAGGGAALGSVHATVQEHPLSAVPLLGRLLRFNVGPLVTPGGNYTVNVASTDEFAAPFASSWGPSLRHVVDFGDVDGAGGFILPTGQSGYPLSPHYRDQTTRWLKGQLWILPL